MPTLISKGYTLKAPEYKLIDLYQIKSKATYTVNINNIRLANRQLLANVEENYDTSTLVNDHCVFNKSRKLSGGKSIFKAFDSKEEFLKAFNLIADKNTDIQFTINVEELPDNAPILLKTFFQSKLSAEPLERLMKEVEIEIRNRKQNIKVEGELKKSLTQDIMKFIDNQAINNTFTFVNTFKTISSAILLGMVLFALKAGVGASAIGVILNISVPLLFGACMIGIIATSVVALKQMTQFQKYKATALIKLGEFENEDTNLRDKTNLATKLYSALHPKDEIIKFTSIYEDDKTKKTDCINALEIGQQSYNSYFVQFTSFFKSAAYHPGYYVGQEMAAKCSLKNAL